MIVDAAHQYKVIAAVDAIGGERVSVSIHFDLYRFNFDPYSSF